MAEDEPMCGLSDGEREEKNGGIREGEKRSFQRGKQPVSPTCAIEKGAENGVPERGKTATRGKRANKGLFILARPLLVVSFTAICRLLGWHRLFLAGQLLDGFKAPILK